MHALNMPDAATFVPAWLKRQVSGFLYFCEKKVGPKRVDECLDYQLNAEYRQVIPISLHATKFMSLQTETPLRIS